MTNLREAAQMALDALEDACGNRCNREYNPCLQREAAEALRAALAQQENQRARDSLPLMVEALEKLEQRQKALAQPEQEPVACDCDSPAWCKQYKKCNRVMLGIEPYVAPPQREWHGLTEDEQMQIWENTIRYVQSEVRIKDFARAIEAKLKEKNT